jgi:lysine-N-methylase
VNPLKAHGPNYLKTFRCIGASCIDNCCIGWDVDFDKKAFLKYKALKSPTLSPIIAQNVYVKKYPSDPAVDYAGVKLKKGKRCPFLDTENWCQIQKEFGEDYLSNVCWHFPRYLNKTAYGYELSATLSCPVVAEMVLGGETYLSYGDITLDPSRNLLTYDLSGLSQQAFSKFEQTRQQALSILSKHEMSLEERLDTLNALEIKPNIKQRVFEKECKDLLTWIKLLNPTDESLSSRYLAFSALVINGLGLKKSQQKWQLDFVALHVGFKKHVAPFIEKAPTVLSNYFEHYYFKSLYPYSETIEAVKLYGLSRILYLLILVHLAGLGMAKGSLEKEDVVQFLSAFTKAVEHHHTFFDQLIDSFEKNPVDEWLTLDGWIEGLRTLEAIR